MPQNRVTCLHRKKRLIHKQNKKYDIKVRVAKYMQRIYNQNQKLKITKLASKLTNIY